MNSLEIKKKLLKFTVKEVKKFLKENPDLKFYAFAYDCNSEYAEVNLCFNTIEDFNQTLNYYKNGKYGEDFKSDEAIRDLKYNTGDWEYQCFETINVLSEEKLEKIYNDFPDDDYKSQNLFIEELMELFAECIIEFRASEVYESIPKSENFISFCIDHDEDFEDAEQRMLRIENKKKE